MRRIHVVVTGVVCALGLCACTEKKAPTGGHETAKLKEAQRKVATLEKAPLDRGPASEAQHQDPMPAAKSVPHRSVSSMKLAPRQGGSGEALGIGGLGIRGAGSGGGGLGAQGIGGIGSGVGYGSGVGTLGGGRGGIVTGPAVVRGYGAEGRMGRARANPGGTEDYGPARVNEWTLTEVDHLSTFAADVDTASYTLARGKLLAGQPVPPESVRVEEWLNYFRYKYPQPPADAPLAVFMDAAPSPFTRGKHLLRVGLQGRQLDMSERKPAHLTFLVDVSGSMSGDDRLPLAKRALRMLVDRLNDGDTVSLVTYASDTRVVLPPVGLEQKARIHQAIEDLSAGGSTAMGSGIQLAYQQALKTLDSKSITRVIILSDGDANVGETSQEGILKLIAGHVKEGVTVTTVGFGMGNYKSALMEQFADKGNGNHYYVDSLMAARRIFVEQLGGTLEVIAKDVKLQVDFNPAQVNAYRLVGYENRDVADRDFRNDRVDAGELGSGHTVTALYELDLKEGAGEGLVTVRIRAKRPRGEEATERAFGFQRSALAKEFAEAAPDFRFAVAVMGAAELTRRSPAAAEWSLAQVAKIARGATPAGNAEREEFLSLLGFPAQPVVVAPTTPVPLTVTAVGAAKPLPVPAALSTDDSAYFSTSTPPPTK